MGKVTDLHVVRSQQKPKPKATNETNNLDFVLKCLTEAAEEIVDISERGKHNCGVVVLACVAKEGEGGKINSGFVTRWAGMSAQDATIANWQIDTAKRAVLEEHIHTDGA